MHHGACRDARYKCVPILRTTVDDVIDDVTATHENVTRIYGREASGYYNRARK